MQQDPDPRQIAYAARRKSVTDLIGLDIAARQAAELKLLDAVGIDPSDTAKVAESRWQRDQSAPQ